jgi:replicative DNA helicase
VISNDEKERLNGRLEELLKRVTTKAKYSNNWICPLCKSGSKRNKTSAFEVYRGGDRGFYCHACQTGGDIFTLVARVDNLDSKNQFSDVLKRTYELLGESLPTDSCNYNTNKQIQSMDNEARKCIEQDNTVPIKKDYTDYINQCICNLENNDAVKKYLSDRGLTEEIIKRFRLGYDEDYYFKQDQKRHKAVVIPYSADNSYYCGRVIDQIIYQDKQVKVDKPKIDEAGHEPVFNVEALYNEDKFPVFITEGYFDAITAEQLGFRAVALGGTGYKKLINQLEEKCTESTLIIALDNDERGITDTSKISEILKEENITHITVNLPKHFECKDLNEALIKGKSKELTEVLTSAVEEAKNYIDEIKEEYYRKNSVAGHIQSFLNWINTSKNKAISTGFEKLDKALYGGLIPMNLYMLGAISSIGKTAFTMQMADNIAKNGSHVLVFALEMSRNSLMARSISRTTFIKSKNEHTAKSMRHIIDKERYEKYFPKELQLIQNSIEEYKSYAGNLFINEGIGDLGIREITNILDTHIKAVGTKPVLIVDYLQLLSPYNDRFTDKQNTDKAVLELKRISRDYDIPVLCISSFNRSAYNAGAKMEGFKESGGIEYTADVVLGMQFLKQDESNFNVDKAKEDDIRDIVIKILKYRDGACGRVGFKYYSKFNYFTDEL